MRAYFLGRLCIILYVYIPNCLMCLDHRVCYGPSVYPLNGGVAIVLWFYATISLLLFCISMLNIVLVYVLGCYFSANNFSISVVGCMCLCLCSFH